MLTLLLACSDEIVVDDEAGLVGCAEERTTETDTSLDACYDQCEMFWLPDPICHNMWVTQSDPLTVEMCWDECDRATIPVSTYEGAMMRDIWPQSVEGYLYSYGSCAEAADRAGRSPCEYEQYCTPPG